MALVRAVALLLFLNALSTTQGLAQSKPVWQTPADTIAVLSTSGNAGFSYALLRDGSMRNHNTYCVTIGAHIGKLRVVSIGPKGVVLSNGRLLPTTLVATGQAISPP